MDSHLTDISRVIQLAVAPVFLLTAIATLINSLNSRLGRIVDRRRVVQERLPAQSADAVAAAQAEIGMLVRRSQQVYYAIFCAVLSALLVCLWWPAPSSAPCSASTWRAAWRRCSSPRCWR